MREARVQVAQGAARIRIEPSSLVNGSWSWDDKFFSSNTDAVKGSRGSMNWTLGSGFPNRNDGVGQHASATVEGARHISCDWLQWTRKPPQT